ncbi:hypothetical protein ASG95_14470 [Phycicoccus sp. Soil803]|nr:hypothetical protein ASG95_14470 [Phycicoccus sp. Soil803]
MLVTALLALVAKLALAASTGGTQDLGAWKAFAKGVREQGPVGVYAIDFSTRDVTQYNHPPLVGYLLEALAALERVGVPLQFSLRATAAISDVVCALVLFEILRRRKSVGAATVAGVALAASPILLLVAGYHGNTDPLMMLLLWLGTYLVVDRRMAAVGGIALALAISVKLAPIVALPTLAAWLLGRRDLRLLLRAAAGFVVTIGIVWGPAIVSQWDGVRTNVLGYAGVGDRPWGLVKMMDAFNLPTMSAWLIGPGRYLILLICAFVPAVLVWRRPGAAMECVALSLIAFLVLSPAFGVQYLAWAAAATLILRARVALAYNILGGLFLFAVYADWNHGLDWSGTANGQPFRPIEAIAGVGLWAILVAVVFIGLRRVLAAEGTGGAQSHLRPLVGSAFAAGPKAGSSSGSGA